MVTTPGELLDRARGRDLGGLLRQGLGGVLLAIATGLISGVLSIFDVFILPLQALAQALAQLTIAIFGSPARIVIAGAQATIQSLLGPFSIGPFTFALGIGAVLLGFYVVNRYLSAEETGNIIPGLPFDVPTPGVEGPEEEEGD